MPFRFGCQNRLEPVIRVVQEAKVPNALHTLHVPECPASAITETRDGPKNHK